MLSKRLLVNSVCEFGPIVGFLLFFELMDFMAGVIAMMIATVLVFVVLRHIEHHTPMFALISATSVLAFGGLSLLVDTPRIFILRDTVMDIIFGCVLVASVWYGKPLLQPIFQNVFAITDRGWRALSLRWGVFFLMLAAVNEWARRSLSPDDWVTIKIAIVIASVVFGVYQFTLTKRERLSDATAWGIRV